VVTARRGASTLGCLFTVLVAATVLYFGFNIGEVYWRYYEYQDSMGQEVRFAAHYTDDQIVRHLRARADSLGLPEAAGNVILRRDRRDIAIDAEYYERVELPLLVREIHFNPHADGSF
jgi:hypothetical protein